MNNFYDNLKIAFERNWLLVLGLAFICGAWILEKIELANQTEKVNVKMKTFQQANNIENQLISIRQTSALIEYIDKSTRTLPTDSALFMDKWNIQKATLMAEIKHTFLAEMALIIYGTNESSLELDSFTTKLQEVQNVFASGNASLINSKLVEWRTHYDNFNFAAKNAAIVNHDNLVKDVGKTSLWHLVFYIIGTVLIVFQRIKNSVKESVTN